MGAKDRRWVPLVPEAPPDARSTKSVLSSNQRAIRALAVDEAGVGSTRVRYQLSGLWQDKLLHDGVDYDTFETGDGGFSQREGEPRIPQEGVFVAIPENAVLKDAQVVSKVAKEIPGRFLLLPAPKPVLEGQEVQYTPLRAVYESDEQSSKQDVINVINAGVGMYLLLGDPMASL